MTKKVILVALLAVGSFSLRAQQLSPTDKADLNSTIAQFMKHTESMNFEGIVDMTYPKVFDLVTKQQMLSLLNGLSGMGFEVSYDSITNQEPILVAKNDSVKYALVNYYSEMVMKITKEEMKTKESIDILKLSLLNTAGVESIDYVEETSSLIVKGNKRLLAIKDQAYDDQWSAIEFDVNNPALNAMLVPTPILTEISEFINKN
ncbi:MULTISPECIES: hypothetical protein [Roseivirga]|uniref:DUF4252 domain-containing protein n=1 Tax=Roseivirga spongicola TaxID=333140 RepID=A0A150XG42_9BACT|nr:MULTISPECIES: hypothetical protein [Roseivirga]KYG77679.1 hypothetical protein AWW68_02600 [Roseivirga spongicola]MBO6661518.1 hypothetical protein [Roseivirga sp.]MBO6762180.1 hypothetical protein [Roseivirga sp.]MBO6908498.1 hypothetical protein [Roseivirga sp.]WPZ11398.1 hypothetical protein T7867_04680 [Roseivirga spongicola]|tara:strand:- start:62 stop:673 length:612 start_codon:yes stop_codon:yes gene_type:complete